MNLELAKQCMKFIDESVSCFHVIENMEKRFQESGFLELKEKEAYEIKTGGNYYIKRNDSSIIAFRIPQGEIKGFHIVASHSDSPTFKIKNQPEIALENSYIKLNTEPYGGMIYAAWLDRCLSVAGRVIYQEENQLKCKIINIDEDLLVIPNLAIHMNREMNKNLSYNPQIDLQPLYCADEVENTFSLTEKIAASAQLMKEDILGQDLFLYVREKGKTAGAHQELMISPRLDDLECVYVSMESMLRTSPEHYISVCAVFDNEEVGSHTRQGAASTFLKDSLERIAEALHIQKSDYLQLLADSFMISADNAHALHPNHPEKADVHNRPVLNKGIVIKYHGGQKYTTDAYTEAVVKCLCQKADVPWQTYCNRSDLAGGSTLGNIVQSGVSVPCADIGLAQLAMHSAVETAGSRDVEYLLKMLQVFYEQ